MGRIAPHLTPGVHKQPVPAARARLRNACLRMAGHKPHARLALALRGVSTITACIRWVQFTQKHS